MELLGAAVTFVASLHWATIQRWLLALLIPWKASSVHWNLEELLSLTDLGFKAFLPSPQVYAFVSCCVYATMGRNGLRELLTICSGPNLPMWHNSRVVHRRVWAGCGLGATQPVGGGVPLLWPYIGHETAPRFHDQCPHSLCFMKAGHIRFPTQASIRDPGWLALEFSM